MGLFLEIKEMRKVWIIWLQFFFLQNPTLDFIDILYTQHMSVEWHADMITLCRKKIILEETRNFLLMVYSAT